MLRPLLCVILLGTFLAPLPAEEYGEQPLCPVPIGGETKYGGTHSGSFLPWMPPFFRDTPQGAYAQPGTPGGSTEGHPHYDLPSRHYGVWYRPSAFSEATGKHCRDRPYAPRGYGWANRKCGFEMDYHPYVVKELPSMQGPSYYCRPPLEACPCKLQGCRPAYDGQH